MTTYQVTFSVALVLQKHDDDTRALTSITYAEVIDALDAELPTTLWCTDNDGDEHGYDVKGSTVTITSAPVRIPDREASA